MEKTKVVEIAASVASSERDRECDVSRPISRIEDKAQNGRHVNLKRPHQAPAL